MGWNNTELLFERDPDLGTVTTFIASDDGNSFTIREQQDVTALIEINKYLASMGRQKGDIKKLGSIPLTLLGEMMQSWRNRGLTHEERQAELAAWLNASDNAAFRTDGRSKV